MRLSSELELPVVLDRLLSSDGRPFALRRRCKLAKHVITGKTRAGAVDEYWNDGRAEGFGGLASAARGTCDRGAVLPRKLTHTTIARVAPNGGLI
jgi:hypothetical protein